MKSLSLAFSVVFLFVALPLSARAQQPPSDAPPKSPPAWRGVATVSFTLGIPRRAFRNSLDATGYGGTLFAGGALRNAPLVLGASFDALVYGFERREVPFSSTIPDVRVDVTTTNAIFGGHAVARIQPSGGRVRPYLGGLAGLKYFNTMTRIREDRFNRRGDEIASSTNFHDVALSYGVSGGIDVALSATPGGTGLALNAGVRYLFGGEAEYLEEGSIQRLPGARVSYDVIRSRTAMLLPQLGLTVTF